MSAKNGFSLNRKFIFLYAIFFSVQLRSLIQQSIDWVYTKRTKCEIQVTLISSALLQFLMVHF